MNKISKIVSLLEEEYGRVKFDKFDNPMDELIVTILSQNTTWQNCRRAFDNLKGKFINWKGVMAGDLRHIAGVIKCGGLGNLKARRIRGLLRQIYKVDRSLSLRFLSRMEETRAIEFLTSFKGVGPKTAACVLLFSCRRPVLPVDTHILRVSKRLGLIGGDVDLVDAHKLLGQIMPKDRDLILSFHINMIEHGRRVCKAHRPRCDYCVLGARICNFSRRPIAEAK